MKNTIDMHIHTLHSDGTDSLKKVLEKAQCNGLEYISISDHESMEAYKNINEMNNYKLTIIPGLELHTYYQGQEVHLLAYGLDHENPEIESYLKRLRQERSEISYETVERIRKKGIELDWEKVLEKAGKNVAITKGHLIRCLADLNIEDKEIYFNFFNPLGASYIDYKKNPFHEAFDIVESNKGKAVLAHPGLINNDNLVEDIIKKFKPGLEVYYYYYGNKRDSLIRKYKTMSEKYDTIYSGGSDYHGHITPSELGGVYVPHEVAEMLLA